MYLHLGLDKVIRVDDIIGIFDLENTTASSSNITNSFLSKATADGIVENVCTDLPKSFVLCLKDGARRVYITQIAPSTILKRISNKYKGLL